MISIITSVNNKEQYDNFFLPSINKLQKMLDDMNLPSLDLITVTGNRSIASNYNDGMRRAIYKIKVFVHQDVDLGEGTWLFKLLKVFAEYPDVGLVGLVGTRKLPEQGFWWESGKEHIVGEVFSGAEKADWSFMPVIFPTEVECIDGFFMATNEDLPWDEKLVGFHVYDMDYSRTIKKHDLRIMVIPHKAWHIGAIRNDKPDMTYYNQKWGK